MTTSINKYGPLFLASTIIAAIISSYDGVSVVVESFTPTVVTDRTTNTAATQMIGSRPSAAFNTNNIVTSLYMSDSPGADGSKQKKKRPDDSGEGDGEGGGGGDEEPQVEEDPEVVALKAEIGDHEATLAKSQSSLQYALDQCEEYSKTGYARKVAEMENMRRVRSNMASSSQNSAISGVLRDFLPAFDTLNALQAKYSEDSFGGAYSELTLGKTFADLGVTDYNVEPGEPVNNFRMKVLENELSTEFAKDTIIRQTVSGLEIDGNVIRAASCVASSGTGEESEGESKGETTE
mmetsp:Transcript_4719/g.12015  ORF Transcript_4719/g.12015 Transcript_4719/m.12015 type:complete len:293 (-) Transcript_4719:92-970(-)